MENGIAQNPIYTFGDNGIEPVLWEFVPSRGEKPYRRVSAAEMVALIQAADARASPATAFYLALLVLISAEPQQRDTIRQKLNRRLRSIKIGLKPIQEYLRYALRTVSRSQHTEVYMVENNDFDHVISEALSPLRQSLGMPSDNVVRYAYPITPSVIASASNPECRLYLESPIYNGTVYEGGLATFSEDLAKRFPDDHDAVMGQLKSGQTREHLSAMSLIIKATESYVTIVNHKGHALAIPGRKLEALISDVDQTKTLGIVGKKGLASGLPEVEFNSPVPKGKIIGRYEARTSVLHVVALKEADESVGFSTVYILDPDLLLCHFMVIRRQREDWRRYELLLDQSAVPVDPFRHLNVKEVP